MPSKEHEALVEKVAKAIHEALVKRGAVPWDKFVAVNPSAKELKIEEAQAAISTIRAALQELDANQEQIGFREAFDSFQMLDGEPFLQTDVAQRVFSAVLAASALGEQSE